MRAIAAFLFASGLWSAVLIDPVSSQQPEAPLKIGLLDDFSSVYSHIGGVMDLEAAKMAIEDFGGVMFGKPIQLVSAEALNKPDIAASIAGVPAAVELDVLRHGASFRYQFLNGRGRDTHTSGSGVLSQRPPPRLPRPAALPRLAVESSRGHPDPFRHKRALTVVVPARFAIVYASSAQPLETRCFAIRTQDNGQRKSRA